MKTLKIFFLAAFVGLAAVSCKNEAKKEGAETAPKTVAVAADIQEASFAISGMTCEIGCAKTIQSKLAKKDGVVEAKVVFTDSIAKVKYDANKLDKVDLMAFVNGIADGETYSTSDIVTDTKTTGAKKECKPGCEKKCDGKKAADKKECKPGCEMACCTKKEDTKAAA